MYKIHTLVYIHTYIGIHTDTKNKIYIADNGNNLIRVIEDGLIKIFAGTGSDVYNGNNILARYAGMKPHALFVDMHDQVFITDSVNRLVRMVNSLGIIINVAGVPEEEGWSR
jgi:hypothetical protein